MKIPVTTFFALRRASTAVSTAENISVGPVALTSEFFDHIRYQVYGDSKKVDKIVVQVQTENELKPILVNRNVSTAFHCFNREFIALK
uniref:Uncharacterized protein n=1 Tax=Caenorhabditis japonica TaxID=281687 RepID=A0A8R1IQD1_CAEJA